MTNAPKLKNRVDPEGKFKYFVFPHLPEAFRAARAKFKKIIADLEKKRTTKPCTRITGTKLFVDGGVYQPLIQPPSPSKVVNRMQLYGDKGLPGFATIYGRSFRSSNGEGLGYS